MTQSILVKKFDNGLTLLAEPMSWVESAAFSLLVPAGCAYDPLDRLGLANFTGEMMERGSGPRDSRQFIEELELLGVDSSSSVLSSHAAFGAAMIADRLPQALTIFADVVRRPRFPEEEVEEARTVCLQDIRSIEDDLARLTMSELVRRQYPDPWGRESHGKAEAVEAFTLDDAKEFFARHYQPQGAILSVAGNVDWAKLCKVVEKLFGNWEPRDPARIVETPMNGPLTHHMSKESNQTHIAMAYDSIPYSHPDYYKARGAVGVLSDGMSSRLFTEVREKRGLSYTVYAMCQSLRDRGSVLAYAQTSVEKAQETCDVMLAELRRLADGIEPAELSRLKARMKRAIIMQQESSSARASELASDWYYLGRVRTLAEITQVIDQLTVESINAYLSANPPRRVRVVTLGGQGVEVADGVS